MKDVTVYKPSPQKVSKRKMTKAGKLISGLIACLILTSIIVGAVSSSKSKYLANKAIEVENAIQRAVLLVTSNFPNHDWSQFEAAIQSEKSLENKQQYVLQMLSRATQLSESQSVTDELNGARNRVLFAYTEWQKR